MHPPAVRVRQWSALVLFLAMVSCKGPTYLYAEPPAEGPAVEGQESEEEQEPETPGKTWRIEIPKGDEFEWIKLTSGEWLKGEITVLNREVLTFESKELDDLQLDWEDVAEIHTTRPFTVLLNDRRQTVGSIDLEGDEFVVRDSNGGELRLPRGEVQRFVAGEPRERNYWSGTIRLSGTTRSGNTNQTDVFTHLDVTRRTARNRFVFSIDTALSEVNDEQTANNKRSVGAYDVFINPRFFVTPIGFEVFRDKFQNIDLRFTPYAGVGYTLLDRKKISWDIVGGLGYRFTEFDSVEQVESSSDDGATIVFGTTLDTDVTKTIDFDLTYNAQVKIDNTNDTVQNLNMGFSIDAWKDLDVDLRVRWDRVGEPVPDEEGNVPEKDDFLFEVGIAYEF